MRRLLPVALCLGVSLSAQADVQPNSAADQAMLVGDQVTLQAGDVLVATGHVEVFFHGQHLTASQVIYDQSTDRLSITGPIRIDDGLGNVLLGDQADLSADLTEGILASARLMLQQKLQIAGSAMLRSGAGRYTAMRDVAASSCTICAGSTTPLWEIRAHEVVHDAQAQQIWFSHATLRFVGIPMMYLPILRVPDPRVDRATGFLTPKIRTTTALGTGVLLPYFIVLGPNRDVTLTPFVTSGGGSTLNLRYRQAFTQGTLTVNGAMTNDQTLPGQARGYLAVTGDFDLGKGYKLDFHGITVSDDAYLVDYGITEADRLDSSVQITKVQRDTYFSGELTGLHSLREGESNTTQPAALSDVVLQRRLVPTLLGGESDFEIQSHSLYRPSDVSATNGDGVADGRDMVRISFKGDWRRNWTFANGMQLSSAVAGEADFYRIGQDEDYAGHPSRSTAIGGLALRWPWVKSTAEGTVQVIEPVVQIVSAPNPDTAIPNEDSSLVEFDESNLFGLDRFPGADAFEGGTRMNMGLHYLRTAPAGWTVGATAGRVLRQTDLSQFSGPSGLSGTSSDWLVSGSVDSPGHFGLLSRVLLDDDLELTKAEVLFHLKGPKVNVLGGYRAIQADQTERRTQDVRELVLDSTYDVTRNWTAHLTNRYDLVSQRAAQAGLRLNYSNECVFVDLSVSRRYTSSTNVEASTDFGLMVELVGFGGSASQGPQHMCRK
ncbi:MAG: LPS assembly protein LptD [Pseudomonadota bacterium]